MFNATNFHLASQTVFTLLQDDEAMPFATREPDYISESGSKYWYTEAGVVRCSDHWGRVASCAWQLDVCLVEADTFYWWYRTHGVYDAPDERYLKDVYAFADWDSFEPKNVHAMSIKK